MNRSERSTITSNSNRPLPRIISRNPMTSRATITMIREPGSISVCLSIGKGWGPKSPPPLLVMGHVAPRCLAAAPAGPSGVRRGPATEVLLLATLIETLDECYVHDLADRVLP